MPTALITGITGMDGSHLADYLLEQGYAVHGLVRRTSTPNTSRIAHLKDQVLLHEGDLTDQGSIAQAIAESDPDEIYNLAAQSFVGVSWDQPLATNEVTGSGAVRVFEAARQYNRQNGSNIRIYQASTSELFGNIPAARQGENTPFRPCSPYAAAKLYAHEMARVYRESYGMFVACGILFNHESPRRGEQFVTRKITKGVAAIVRGEQDVIRLGNLDALRDWGYAPDYVRAMHLMLQQTRPDDFVVGTGRARSVSDFLAAAFQAAGIDDWGKHVEIDPQFKRPNELHVLRANPLQAKRVLGWEPTTPFAQWVAEMVQSDIALK